jgi:hypothetical protein
VKGNRQRLGKDLDDLFVTGCLGCHYPYGFVQEWGIYNDIYNIYIIYNIYNIYNIYMYIYIYHDIPELIHNCRFNGQMIIY